MSEREEGAERPASRETERSEASESASGEAASRAARPAGTPLNELAGGLIAGSCIEGIGPDLAATLYEAYPTVAELVAADREVLTDTSGSGEKRARTVVAALRDRPIAD